MEFDAGELQSFSKFYGVDPKKLEEIRSHAKVAIQRGQERMMSRLNIKKRVPEYNVGDLVYVRSHDYTTFVARKWSPKFVGPYKVIEIVNPLVIRIQHVDFPDWTNTVHVAFVRPVHTRSKSPPPSHTPSPFDDFEDEDAFEAASLIDKGLVDEHADSDVDDVDVVQSDNVNADHVLKTDDPKVSSTLWKSPRLQERAQSGQKEKEKETFSTPISSLPPSDLSLASFHSPDSSHAKSSDSEGEDVWTAPESSPEKTFEKRTKDDDSSGDNSVELSEWDKWSGRTFELDENEADVPSDQLSTTPLPPPKRASDFGINVRPRRPQLKLPAAAAVPTAVGKTPMQKAGNQPTKSDSHDLNPGQKLVRAVRQRVINYRESSESPSPITPKGRGRGRGGPKAGTGAVTVGSAPAQPSKQKPSSSVDQ